MSVIRPIDIWFAEEILPYEPRLLDAARRICRSKDEAADLVQEAFARLLALEGWAGIANPQAYALRALRHIAIERIRRQRIVEFHQLTEIDHLALPDSAPDPERVATGRDSLRHVGRIIAALPERCRTVFVRRRIEGESSKAIAADLGISLSTFEKRLARAIELVSRATLAVDEQRADARDGRFRSESGSGRGS